MNFENIAMVITFIPALAWFVTAGIKIAKLYEKHEVEIKDTAERIKDDLEDTIQKASQKAAEKAKDAKNDSNPTQQ